MCLCEPSGGVQFHTGRRTGIVSKARQAGIQGANVIVHVNHRPAHDPGPERRGKVSMDLPPITVSPDPSKLSAHNDLNCCPTSHVQQRPLAPCLHRGICSGPNEASKPPTHVHNSVSANSVAHGAGKHARTQSQPLSNRHKRFDTRHIGTCEPRQRKRAPRACTHARRNHA